MKKWEYSGEEVFRDLKSNCDEIEEVKVKKVKDKWIVRFYTRTGTVFELTVTDIKEWYPAEDGEKYVDWVDEGGE